MTLSSLSCVRLFGLGLFPPILQAKGREMWRLAVRYITIHLTQGRLIHTRYHRARNMADSEQKNIPSRILLAVAWMMKQHVIRGWVSFMWSFTRTHFSNRRWLKCHTKLVPLLIVHDHLSRDASPSYDQQEMNPARRNKQNSGGNKHNRAVHIELLHVKWTRWFPPFEESLTPFYFLISLKCSTTEHPCGAGW